MLGRTCRSAPTEPDGAGRRLLGGLQVERPRGRGSSAASSSPYELPILYAARLPADRPARRRLPGRPVRLRARPGPAPGPGAEQPRATASPTCPAPAARRRCSPTTPATASCATRASTRASRRPGGRPMRRERTPAACRAGLIGLVLVIVIAIASVPRVHEGAAVGRRLRDQGRVRLGAEPAPGLAGADRRRRRRQGRPQVEHLERRRAEVTAQAGGEPPAGDEPTGQQAAVVTMELNEDALPLHEDATFKLRPRLFLEGNYFVDVQPGQPERAGDGRRTTRSRSTRPSNSVQLDQVLTTLQGDVRADLQTFLDQFGNALVEARRRGGLPRALPHLGAGRQVHVAGQRGRARHAARRPLGPDHGPRPGRPRARPQRG